MANDKVFNMTLLEDLGAEICDQLCKYRDTCDEDCVCDYMREHDGKCPLDALY